MKCPFCNYYDTKVVDSRPTEEGQAIRRRRECIKCSKRFTTYEKTESIPLIIVKKDGNREPYDRNKIMTGILKACEKRPVPLKVIEDIVDQIEKELYNSMDKEVTSQHVGEIIMSKLKDLDEVAYVRFASVYRQFKDINTFMEELKKLLGEEK
ncbi:MAG: transcriptional repressor NrdR [Tissierellia bacterium]|nr:transcriptional repressor NrdR [Tissierellia bacterium]